MGLRAHGQARGPEAAALPSAAPSSDYTPLYLLVCGSVSPTCAQCLLSSWNPQRTVQGLINSRQSMPISKQINKWRLGVWEIWFRTQGGVRLKWDHICKMLKTVADITQGALDVSGWLSWLVLRKRCPLEKAVWVWSTRGGPTALQRNLQAGCLLQKD